jgi:hypothetical protein
VSRLAEDARLIEVVGRTLARQAIHPDTPSVFALWKALDADTRRGYRDRAVEVLVAMDVDIERLERKEPT